MNKGIVVIVFSSVILKSTHRTDLIYRATATNKGNTHRLEHKHICISFEKKE